MTLDRDVVAAALSAYELEGELGRGGWGIVIAGRHRQLGREVAIKQLPRAFAADPAVRARFVTEARLLASLDHPHIVPVYDFVELDGVCVLVMEKLSGGTVWSRFTGDGLSMATACAVALATCAALGCAHGDGILHRDIKPENLLFTDAEVLKVTDFGIAKVVGGNQTLATRAGEVLGTPAYMAPEQAQAKELSPATDVYATGMMLYELLAGKLPFPEDADALTTLYRHAFEPPAPLTDAAPQVPPALADVVMQSIATDPAARYPTAEAFGVALAEAATATWGPGWLSRGDTPVMGASKIVAATERASRPVAEAKAKAPETVAAKPPAPPTERVRASVAVRPPAQALDEIDAADLVPVHQVVKRPPNPAPLALVALALLVVTLALAFAGLGTPEYESGPALTVNGVAVGDEPVELDLADPVTIAGELPGPDVTLAFSAMGVPLGSATATADAGTASLDATGARYLVAGEVTAEVTFRSAGSTVGRRTFPATSSQSPLLTAPGIGGIVLVLFVAAYAESLLRARRRGRKVFTAQVGMAVIGALAGVALVIAAWLLGAGEPVVA
ncbi:MAG TPA: protein kinase, partial [Acidimicrobiales bacterium]|nr:protein kinase [Acidimicrobiales bacterium]